MSPRLMELIAFKAASLLFKVGTDLPAAKAKLLRNGNAVVKANRAAAKWVAEEMELLSQCAGWKRASVDKLAVEVLRRLELDIASKAKTKQTKTKGGSHAPRSGKGG